MLSNIERDEQIARGLNFINENGSDHTKAIGNAIVNPDTVDETLNALRPFQNADGGWRGLDSDMKGPISTISCIWVAMQLLSWLNCKDAECAERTIDFILNAQNVNGSWDEPEEILKFDPPPWMAIVIFYHLREDSEINETIAKGRKKFLTQQILEDKEDSFDFVDIAYASLRVGSWADDLLKLSTDRMLESQAEDGGWITNYGDSHRPMGTAKAIYLLKLLSNKS